MLDIDIKGVNKLQELKNSMMKEEVKHINKIDMNINKNVDKNIDGVNGDSYNKLNVAETDWKNREYKRAEVYYADLSGNLGSEQGNGAEGLRPVVIIQNDIGNKYSPTVIVAVLTSRLAKPKLPTHLDMTVDKYNLPKNSIALFEQVRTLDKRRLKDKICYLGDEMQKKLDNAVDVSMKNLPTKTYLEKLPTEMRQYIINTLKEIKRKEIQIKEMKKDDFEECYIKRAFDKKMNILKQFIMYCNKHQLDYEQFYVLNKGINERVKSELIAL